MILRLLIVLVIIFLVFVMPTGIGYVMRKEEMTGRIGIEDWIATWAYGITMTAIAAGILWGLGEAGIYVITGSL